MPVKPEREYRTASPFTAIPQESEEKSYIVEGYATTFDVPYELEGFDGEKEIILRSALDGADMSDVIFQENHEGPVLARNSNGSLYLAVDEHGLFTRADLKSRNAGKDLYNGIADGNTTKMSWGFMVAPDGYEYDINTRTCTITKITKVYDVSAVSIPANQGTEIHTRSAFLDGAIEKAEQELLEKRNERARRSLALKAKSIEL